MHAGVDVTRIQCTTQASVGVGGGAAVLGALSSPSCPLCTLLIVSSLVNRVVTCSISMAG